MRYAPMVLFLCATFIPASAQDDPLIPRSSPTSPSAPNLFAATKRPMPNDPVHPIPLSHGSYVHLIPLSLTSDHYVHVIPITFQDQAAATTVTWEKAHLVNPNQHLQPANQAHN